MTRTQLSAALRQAADVIDSLPEFAQPFSADWYDPSLRGAGNVRLQLIVGDFLRLFDRATYNRDGTHEYWSQESKGVLFHACRPLPEPQPREVSLSRRGLEPCEPLVLEDCGEPAAAHAALSADECRKATRAIGEDFVAGFGEPLDLDEPILLGGENDG